MPENVIASIQTEEELDEIIQKYASIAENSKRIEGLGYNVLSFGTCDGRICLFYGKDTLGAQSFVSCSKTLLAIRAISYGEKSY